MRSCILAVAAAAVALPAAAQPVVAESRYGKAPWWMDQPVIASLGSVELQVRANRASIGANFQVVGKTAPEATRGAADKVRALGQALSAYGADKVRVVTTFNMRPIYDQYRDKESNLIANQRADKIDAYEVNANVQVEVRDVSLAERVYATVLAARPTSTQPVYFSLQADNATRTDLFNQAVQDAARRAKLAAAATEVKLGPVKLIDPTGRACETDILVAGAPRDGAQAMPQVFDGRTGFAPPPPPPPPAPRSPGGSELRPEDMQLPLQPPMQSLSAQACVVYALG